MKLSKLLKDVDYTIIGNKLRKVIHLSNIAQDCKDGSIYFCLNGKTNNGSEYIKSAVANGCRVIVSEQSIGIKNITQIIVKDARIAMSIMASNFYDNPNKHLKIIGVTGTNGKTTTTHIIAHILKTKYSVGLVGTNGVFYCGKNYQTGFTTPDPIMFYRILKDMVNSGVEYVVVEYSAHAIQLQKLYGICSEVVAFTNLSQDHLDYFGDMQTYYLAKAKLFEQLDYNNAVICIDDEYGRKISKIAKKVFTCTTKKLSANIFVEHIEHTTNSQIFETNILGKKMMFETHLLGSFNIQNLVVAIAVCLKLNMSENEIADAIKSLNGINGRFECYSNNINTVIIDFAHTPDGLENVLKATCEIAGKNRTICVFGCGGNRDETKRPEMGRIAGEYADYSIITTDNPRFEDNWDIAQEISAGFKKNNYEIILDRGQALRKALEMCREGDVVLLAGKGAETYTEINGSKYYFSDKELVMKVLNI